MARTNECYELSTFTDGWDHRKNAESIKRIKQAFPNLNDDYFDVLFEMLKKENFTSQRFSEAVDYVIKTCVYPTPTIAQFLRYNRTVKLYDYGQMIDAAEKNKDIFSERLPIQIDGYVFWAKKKDVEMFNLELI